MSLTYSYYISKDNTICTIPGPTTGGTYVLDDGTTYTAIKDSDLEALLKKFEYYGTLNTETNSIYQTGRAFSKSGDNEKYEGGLAIKSGIGTLTVTDTTTGYYNVNGGDGYILGSSSEYTYTTVTDYKGVTKEFYWKQISTYWKYLGIYFAMSYETISPLNNIINIANYFDLNNSFLYVGANKVASLKDITNANYPNENTNITYADLKLGGQQKALWYKDLTTYSTYTDKTYFNDITIELKYYNDSIRDNTMEYDNIFVFYMNYVIIYGTPVIDKYGIASISSHNTFSLYHDYTNPKYEDFIIDEENSGYIPTRYNNVEWMNGTELGSSTAVNLPEKFHKFGTTIKLVSDYEKEEVIQTDIIVMITLLKSESDYWNTLSNDLVQITNYTFDTKLTISFNDANNKTVEKEATLKNTGNPVLFDTDLLGLGELSSISIEFGDITLTPISSTNPYLIWNENDDKFYMKLDIQTNQKQDYYDIEYDCKSDGTSSENNWGMDLDLSSFPNKKSFIINLVAYYEDLQTY